MPATTISYPAARSRPRTHLALIVEYHPWLRLTLSKLFQDMGFAVRLASNGASGLRLATHLKPDVVVVGDSLPELSPEQLVADLGTPRVGFGTRVVRTRDLEFDFVEVGSARLPTVGIGDDRKAVA